MPAQTKPQNVYEVTISNEESIAVLADDMVDAVQMVIGRYGDEPMEVKRQWMDVLMNVTE